MAELTDRAKYERHLALVLGRLGARQRKELEKKLGNPPMPSKVPEGWWRDKERELEAVAVLLLLGVFESSAIQHGLEPDAAKLAAQTFAEQRAAELAKGFTQHSKEMLDTAERDWRVKREANETFTPTEIRETTLKLFGPNRMANVAVTETTVGQHQGSETAIEETVGLSEGDLWITENDEKVCPTCSPLHMATRSFWERFFPQGPPAHARCRCYIRYATPAPQPNQQQPVVESFDESKINRGEGGRFASKGSGGVSYKLHSASEFADEPQKLVMVDPKKLDAAWSKKPSNYLGKDSSPNDIEGRRDGVREFLKTGQAVEASQFYLHEDGSVSAKDGRHRFAVLRDRGETSVGLTVDASQAKEFKKRFGAEAATASVLQPGNLQISNAPASPSEIKAHAMNELLASRNVGGRKSMTLGEYIQKERTIDAEHHAILQHAASVTFRPDESTLDAALHTMAKSATITRLAADKSPEPAYANGKSSSHVKVTTRLSDGTTIVGKLHFDHTDDKGPHNFSWDHDTTRPSASLSKQFAGAGIQSDQPEEHWSHRAVDRIKDRKLEMAIESAKFQERPEVKSVIDESVKNLKRVNARAHRQ